MNTTESNKLIAEFMGATLRTFEETMAGDTVFAEFPIAPNPFNSNLGSMSVVHLFYHSSWDWIMPVVEKIETMSAAIHIDSSCVFLHFPNNKPKLHRIEFDHGCKLQGTYEAVVLFITWYNQQSK